MNNLITRSISPDEIAIYNRDGVVHLRGILSLSAVNTLRGSIDQAISTANESDAAYDLTAVVQAINSGDLDSLNHLRTGQYDVRAIAELVSASGHKTLQDAEYQSSDGKGVYHLDSGVAARLKAFGKFSKNESIGAIAGSIMQSNEVRFYDDQIFVKEAGCLEKTAFHQDSTYFHLEGAQTCVMWIPVDPANEVTGSIQYVRGSHKWNQEFQPNVFVAGTPFPGSEEFTPLDQNEIEKHPNLIQFVCEPGDIVIHNYRTVHGAAGNHSSYQVRRAASLRYCGDDMRYLHRPYAPPQAHHIHNLNNGDTLEEARCFPLIWKSPEEAIAA